MSAYDSPEEFVRRGLADPDGYSFAYQERFAHVERRELLFGGRKFRRRQIAVMAIAQALAAGEQVKVIATSEEEAAGIMAEARAYLLDIAAAAARRRFDFAQFAAQVTERTRTRLGLPLETHAWSPMRQVCTVCGVTAQQFYSAR